MSGATATVALHKNGKLLVAGGAPPAPAAYGGAQPQVKLAGMRAMSTSRR